MENPNEFSATNDRVGWTLGAGFRACSLEIA